MKKTRIFKEVDHHPFLHYGYHLIDNIKESNTNEPYIELLNGIVTYYKK